MATTAPAAETPFAYHMPREYAWYVRLGRVARAKPLGAAGAVIIFILAVTALFGQDISIGGTTIVPGFSPNPADYTDVTNRLQGPSFPDHIAGTDSLGRDLFSRIVFGARPAMIIGLAATGLGVILGTIIGMISAYAAGTPDLLIQRVMDTFMSLPPLILLLVLVTVLSPGLFTVIIVLVFFLAPTTQRVIRGTVFSVKQFTYVEAARAVGATTPRVMFRHILPNIMAPIFVIASVTIGGTILTEAALSFLGLGANSASQPTWGFLLFEATQRGNLTRFPWLAIAPGVAITLIVLAFNILGDALRDVLDPRLRGTGAGAS